MEDLFPILGPVVAAVVGIVVYGILESKKQKKIQTETEQASETVQSPAPALSPDSALDDKSDIQMFAWPYCNPSADTALDDDSYIQEMQHQSGKVGLVVWQQYDILLAAQHYGWETMVDWAAYMETADFDSIESLTIVQHISEDAESTEQWTPFETELAHVYNQNKVGLKNFERLNEEQARLSIYGHSRTLNSPVKIVWFNQTRALRVFTQINDETLITRYVETAIRRSFGTPDAMKLAKPIELTDKTQ